MSTNEAKDAVALLESDEGFEVWLRSFPEDTVVGRKNSHRDCPLTHYLKSLGVDAMVGHTHLVVEGKTTVAEGLPLWAFGFTCKIDLLKEKEVTAKVCLEVLHSTRQMRVIPNKNFGLVN